jgi:hypothetical protein
LLARITSSQYLLMIVEGSRSSDRESMGRLCGDEVEVEVDDGPLGGEDEDEELEELEDEYKKCEILKNRRGETATEATGWRILGVRRRPINISVNVC